MKKELFSEVLNNVCSTMELGSEDVLHSNKEECVDARYLVVAVLSERMGDRQIAEVSGWSIQLVNKAKNAFSERCKFRWGLKEMYKEMCIFAPMLSSKVRDLEQRNSTQAYHPD